MQLDRQGGRQTDELLAELEPLVPRSAAKKVPKLLETVPDRDAALRNLVEHFRNLPWKPEPEDCDGRTLYAALTVFGNSRYLSNLLLNWPELLRWALDPDNLERTIPHGELRSDLGSFIAHADDEAAALLLARFKRKHMLRIALRDLLSVAPVADIALDLSTLADVTIQGAYDHIRQQLVRRFGRPLCDVDSGQILCHFSVLALGKLGGSELNFSSDIDLMYVHTGAGSTWGPVVTTNDDFATQLAMRLTRLLSMMTPEGFSYRVDLRLRPEGSAGELVVPISSAVRYYFNRARDWELQMLLKARPVAGNLPLGRRFLRIVTPRIYRTTTDFSQVEKLAETRDRMQKQRRLRPPGTLDVKLDPGGIRDVEFLVQCLQRLYGGQDRFLRSGGTMYALHRLREKGYLGRWDYAKLYEAYSFLRTVEHRLQLADNRQTHELAARGEALERVAFQMGIREGADPGAALQSKVREHFSEVTEIYERVIRDRKPENPSARTMRVLKVADTPAPKPQWPPPVTSAAWRAYLPQVLQFSPQLARQFDGLSLRWGNRAMEQFLERIVSEPAVMGILEQRPGLVSCVREIMEYSPHFARYLLSFPEDVAELSTGHRAAPRTVPMASDGQGWPIHPAVGAAIDRSLDPHESAAMLRRFFRRQMLAIQARSLWRGDDVFSTTSELSELAVWILRAGYSLALREALAAAKGPTETEGGMRVIALGRLGMREFDLGSDADVVFVIPDSESGRAAFWTQVANRIIGIVSSYTADGQMFALDPRLRPLGRDGELVQAESQYLAYFSGAAEPWEAITYMKARMVAGDRIRGREFLSGLQEVIWRGFGRKGEVADHLVRMRRRIEAQKGQAKPLKSGAGGYYDIDFILLYWRLLHAESFYESLNTPQRIGIIRKSRPEYGQDLDDLLRASLIFRTLDHAGRLARGSSSQALPPTEWQRDQLAELVARWLPAEIRNQPLGKLVESTRRTVRGIFRNAFRQ